MPRPAPAACQLTGDVDHDTGCAGANRVADRDGAAVDVDRTVGREGRVQLAQGLGCRVGAQGSIAEVDTSNPGTLPSTTAKE